MSEKTHSLASTSYFNKWHTAAAVLAGLAVCYLVFGLPYAAGYGEYRQTVFQWLKTSWKDATWQHGALAPLIATFLVWRKRKELKDIPVTGTWVGALGILASLFCYWVGYRGNFYFIGYASLQLMLGSVVVWLYGWKFFMKISFAWLIFSFAWPYLFLEDTLAFKLRVLMVNCTSWILNHIGVPTTLDGTRLISAAVDGRKLGELFDLNVDGPCSGLRSLFALMMVSTLFAYFRQRSLWRRCVLFAYSFPLAILANMFRIMILIFGTILFGQEFAVGRGEEYTSNFHILAGMFVYFVALGGMLLMEKVLHKCFGYQKPLRIVES